MKGRPSFLPVLVAVVALGGVLSAQEAPAKEQTVKLEKSSAARRIEGHLGRGGSLDELAEPLTRRFAGQVAEIRAERMLGRRRSRRVVTVALACVVESFRDRSYLVTKASELDGEGQVCRLSGREDLPFKVVATDLPSDLALIEIAKGDLPKLDFRQSTRLDTGRFVVSVGAAGAAGGVGVVSVPSRPISGGGGLLGINGEDAKAPKPGARVTRVAKDSAADKAGIKVGDVILRIEDRAVTDFETLRRNIGLYPPNSSVEVVLRRGESEQRLRAILGSSEDDEVSGSASLWGRGSEMAGGPTSRRKAGFARAVQHDTAIRSSDCGGPLLDLQGRVIGLNIARVGRTQSLALASEDVNEVLFRLLARRSTPATEGR
ncbi:MAG: PDZ domain-containing protein [Planctomycetota bacterium]